MFRLPFRRPADATVGPGLKFSAEVYTADSTARLRDRRALSQKFKPEFSLMQPFRRPADATAGPGL